MKRIRLVVIIIVLSSSTTMVANADFSVAWEGTLKAVHHGDVTGKVALQQFSGNKNLYAVGPVADLDGEITAIDGEFYISRVKHGEVKTDSDLSTYASFLVWSEVSGWRDPVILGEEVDNHVQLEKLLESLATRVGIDTSKPFPFIIEGKVKSVDYHILAPKTPGQAASSHRDGAKNVSSKDLSANIIGFFSKNHGGVFTHMDSMAHLHIIEDNGYSGHVDEIALTAEAVVKFPQ